MASPTSKNRLAAFGYFGAIGALLAWIVYRAMTPEPVALTDAADVDAKAPASSDVPAPPASAIDPRRSAALTTIVRKPSAVTIDAERVYFTDTESELVAWVNKSGGEPKAIATGELVGGGFPRLRALLVDGDELFWTTSKSLIKSDKSHADVAGALAVDLVAPTAIALDGARVYWASEIARGASALWSVPRAGGAVPAKLTTLTDLVCGAAVDERDLFFAEFASGRLTRMPKTGGDAKLVSTDCSCHFVLGPDHVFCSTRDPGGRVIRVPKSSSDAGARTIAALAPDSIARNLAFDGARLFFITETTRGEPTRYAIDSAPAEGGAVRRHVGDDATPALQDLAVDDRWIFWSQRPEIGAPNGPAAIMRIAK